MACITYIIVPILLISLLAQRLASLCPHSPELINVLYGCEAFSYSATLSKVGTSGVSDLISDLEGLRM